MTDKEKILAEIQKRIEFQKTCIKNDYRLTGRAEEEIIFEYQKLINFINTLSNESISEKMCMYSKDNYTDEDRKVLCDGCEEECKFKPTTSVWHSAKDEKPTKGRKIVVLTSVCNIADKNISFMGEYIGNGYIQTLNAKEYINSWAKWAYIDDLLKL